MMNVAFCPIKTPNEFKICNVFEIHKGDTRSIDLQNSHKCSSFSQYNRTRITNDNIECLVLKLINNLHTQLFEKFLKKNYYRLYKSHISQRLRDLERSIFFCNCFLKKKCQENPQFSVKVLLSDESKFTNRGVFNGRSI